MSAKVTQGSPSSSRPNRAAWRPAAAPQPAEGASLMGIEELTESGKKKKSRGGRTQRQRRRATENGSSLPRPGSPGGDGSWCSEQPLHEPAVDLDGGAGDVARAG